MKYLLIDRNENLSFSGVSLEDIIEQYESYIDCSFKDQQDNDIFICEEPEHIEVEFKIVRKEIPRLVNKEKR